MDSATPPTSSSSSSELSLVAPLLSKRDIFFSTYRHKQEWSLPSNLIYYIAKYPSSSKCYQQLIQSSKYFFVANPLLVVSSFSINYGDGEYSARFNGKYVALQDMSSKLWVTKDFDVKNCGKNPANQYFSSVILPSIFKNENGFDICNQNIVLDDLIFLASKCEDIRLREVTVQDDDGSVVTLEKIFVALPNIKRFSYNFKDTDPHIVTSKSVQEMIKILHFATLTELNLYEVPESFNLDDFYSYIKKNKQTTIRLAFWRDKISDEYKHRLQTFVNKIVQAEERDYKVPYIYYPHIDQASFIKLCNLGRG